MDKQPLKHIRGSLGLTQEDVAKLSGVSQQTITDIERGKIRPRIVTAYKILYALNEKLKEKGKDALTIDSIDWSPL